MYELQDRAFSVPVVLHYKWGKGNRALSRLGILLGCGPTNHSDWRTKQSKCITSPTHQKSVNEENGGWLQRQDERSITIHEIRKKHIRMFIKKRATVAPSQFPREKKTMCQTFL
jgi:hypothetical protein